MNLTHAAIDRLDDSIVLTDLAYKVIIFNTAASALSISLTGRPLRESQDIQDLLTVAQGPLGATTLVNALHHAESEKTFANPVSREGNMMHLEIQYHPLKRDGQLSFLMFVFRDLTIQKQFEAKLSTQASVITQMLENANAIIIGLDTRQYVVEWNKYSSAVTGFGKDEIYAQKFVSKLIPKDDQLRFSRAFLRVLTNQEVINSEINIFTKSNKLVNLLVSMAPRISNTGEPVGAILVGQDITELSEYRKSLEKKIEERTRDLLLSVQKEKDVIEMKNRFVSIASHEFRTPLSSIQFMAQSLQQDDRIKADERLMLQLQDIQRHAERMTYLLNDVLTYSKSEPGKIKIKTSVIPVRDFINGMAHEVMLATGETHGVQVEYRDTPDYVRSDEKLLRNVLINLLTNAIKYSPGRQEVYLQLSGNENQIVIKVKDIGIGIGPEDLPFIFQPFNRAQNAEAMPGTGLGLSIVKRAVDLLEGSIHVNSQLNLGTEVTVVIPIKPGEA